MIMSEESPGVTVSETASRYANRTKAHMRSRNVIQGICLFEQHASAYLRQRFTEVAEEVSADRFGIPFAYRHDVRTGLTLLLITHADEIGGVVKSIRPDSFLRFDRVGYTVPSLLVGRKVVMNGRYGVIGNLAGAHADAPAVRARVTPIDELYGVESASEVAEQGIQIGGQWTAALGGSCFL